MTTLRKGVEVDLLEMGCPYDVLDARTIPWIEGWRAGHTTGIETGAKVVSKVYDEAIGEVIAGAVK